FPYLQAFFANIKESDKNTLASFGRSLEVSLNKYVSIFNDNFEWKILNASVAPIVELKTYSKQVGIRNFYGAINFLRKNGVVPHLLNLRILSGVTLTEILYKSSIKTDMKNLAEYGKYDSKLVKKDKECIYYL